MAVWHFRTHPSTRTHTMLWVWFGFKGNKKKVRSFNSK